MNYEEALEITNTLRASFDSAFSGFQKEQIAALYLAVLGKELKPTSCQNCYHDALIEIYRHLTKYETMANDCAYRLRAGFIINAPAFSPEIYTNDNLTDEVAAAYLKMYPAAREMFQKLPAEEVAAETETENSAEAQTSSKRKKRRK